MRMTRLVGTLVLALFLIACESVDIEVIDPCEGRENCTRIDPGANAQKEAQAALLNAKPGDTIGFAEGEFSFTTTLSLTVEGVTIRGAGKNKTTLSFKNQKVGSEGLLVTAGDFLIEDIAVEDTKGDAIKVEGVKGVTFRNVRVEWTRGPHPENGAYGLYPVQCTDVVIEGSIAIAASDAGIYVGQSRNIIVRNNIAEYNVAGIEVENSVGADVYNNIARYNTGGILVFSLPGLQLPNGAKVRVFNNESHNNNTKNFAPAGNIVGRVPAGTGIMILANSEIEVFENTLRDNNTGSVLLVSYLLIDAQIQAKHPNFYPYPETIYVHKNTFIGGGDKPDLDHIDVKAILGQLGESTVPDIFWDGVRNPLNVVDGQLIDSANLCIQNNGDITFADANDFNPPPRFDLAAHNCAHARLPAISIPGH
jgi:parallel beta-helix repeat protein